MAVTELALLRLLPPTNITTPSLLGHLRAAKLAMEKSSGFEFYYLHCLEDSSLIFIVGGWPSIKFHKEEWIPSEENQKLLEMMEREVEVEVEYMFHIDVEPERREEVLGSEVVAVVRHFVEEGRNEEFRDVFRNAKGKLEEVISGEEKVFGGWRVDRRFMKKDVDWGAGDGKEKPNGDDEWVLFTGWDSMKKHFEFAKTGDFNEYSKIRELIDGADIKHGIVIDL